MSAVANIIQREFPGAKIKIIASNKPLFCQHCDPKLIPEYRRRYDAGAPVADLVAILDHRRGKIIERTWPDRREWACHRCGRELFTNKKGARANVPQKGEKPYAARTIAQASRQEQSPGN